MRVFALAAVVCFSAILLSAAPQADVGTLTGIVKDGSGAAVPGAFVRIAASGRPTRSTVTDSAGAFRFPAVMAGEYEVAVTLAGFKPATVRVKVSAGQTAHVPVVLAVQGVQETVTVTADSPLVSRSLPVVAHQAGKMLAPAAPFNTEGYAHIQDNDFRLVEQNPLSTFSIDVDTASYSNVRRFLNSGRLPPPDAVRTEELINYFRFAYPEPAGDLPVSITTELVPCPWNPETRLALVGVQARALATGPLPARNLVFLLDVSGSMMSHDKLPLVRTAMRMLVDTLTSDDRVAIVVYAGASGLVLPPTPGDHKGRIHEAIAQLEAGGSTNGAAGINLAYQVAQDQFRKGGINRVILATDGDFNVGVTSQGELTRLIEQKRQSGIFLSVLGVGTGNVKDSTMENLADKGNGNYAYLDSLHEARKVLVHEAGATLVTVAKDVKIQIEFNPAHVSAYRLIGYENRLLRNEDFNDDRKDAGEMGAGHTVTALYEIVPPGVTIEAGGVDPLKYQRPPAPSAGAQSDELMTVKLRYKAPDGDESRLIEVAVKNGPGAMTPNAGFAAAIAQFGMLLRHNPYRGTANYTEVAALARAHRGQDPSGYRAEFVRLVELAEALTRHTRK